MSGVRSFDFESLSERERYKILIGTVVPRPIALVTTLGADGRANAAPFSFFNCLSADPAIVALGVENRDDDSPKDTVRNIARTEEFTVNIVSNAILEAMNVCSVPFGADVDELVEAGLTAMPGQRVGCPWIGEAPAALECRRYIGLQIGRSREIVLGQVVAAHIRADLINERLHVEPSLLDAIGRMGGHGYVRSNETFDLPTMSVEDWRRGRPATRRSARQLEGAG
ncbi:MAG: flavin reductase family protein [Geminicoccaceae bacterium]